MDDARKKMQALLNELVACGHERGLQLAVYRDGELVVDAYAGIADPATGQPVTGDTLFPVFSTTKGIAATLIHQLVQRGLLHYDMPIAEVWPDFAAHGKGEILVRHALNHTSGLQYMPMGIGYREIVDWETMCAAIAELTPVSAPGEIFCYHAVTYSWLVGEVVRRVGGKSFGQLLASEITVPLGIADSMFVGIPDEVEPRVAVLDDEYARNSGIPIPDDSEPRDVPGWMQPLDVMMNRPDARRACIPASNGIMSTRALARHYASLLPGGVDGIELLSPTTIDVATRYQPPHIPPAEGANRYGLGYQLMAEDNSIFGSNGYGGSTGFVDLKHNLAVGFAKNHYNQNGTGEKVFNRLREVLGIL